MLPAVRPVLTALFITLFLLTAGCTSAGLFFANNVARLGAYAVTRDIGYGILEEQRLDIYTPVRDRAEHPENKPVVIFFYGGCWGACNTLGKEKYAFAAEALTSNGYIAVLPDYRRYPAVLFPEIIKDAALAVEWVRENIQQYGGRADTIFLMGHSAGAHLAATLTMNEQYLRPGTHESIKGFIGLAGPYDFFPFEFNYQKNLFGSLDNPGDSQPINFVDGSEPPLLLLYGDKDSVVKPRNIENLTARAHELGVDVTSVRYPDINHSELVAALSRVLRARRPVADDVMAFLNEHAGDHN